MRRFRTDGPLRGNNGATLWILTLGLLLTGCGDGDPPQEPEGVDPVANFESLYDTTTECVSGPSTECFGCCMDAGFDRSRYDVTSSQCGCAYIVFDEEMCASSQTEESCVTCCEGTNDLYTALFGSDDVCRCRRPQKTPPGS